MKPPQNEKTINIHATLKGGNRGPLACFLLAFLAVVTAAAWCHAFIQPQLGMGSGNLGDACDKKEMDCKISCLKNFNCPSARLTTSGFFNGVSPTPENLDWVVKKCADNGIVGMILFDYYLKHGPMRNYDQWVVIGKAFAARFQPNSPWMKANTKHPENGVTLWQAFNEPDNTFFGPQIPLKQYHDALKGLADGIHCVNPALKVYPGGYSQPNAKHDFLCSGYCPAVADLINDGTLSGIDLHTYFGPWTPVNDWKFSSQSNFDEVKKACGIKRDIDACVTESGYGLDGESCNHCKISEKVSAGRNLTALWDGLGLVGKKMQSVAQVTHTFTLVLDDAGHAKEPSLAYTVTQCPWVPNERGKVIKLVADLTKGMSFVSLDPYKRGEYVLIGKGAIKKLWVWQNRTNWTKIGGPDYTVMGIPAGCKTLNVYGSAGLIKAIPLKDGQPLCKVTDLEPENTYMFAAL